MKVEMALSTHSCLSHYLGGGQLYISQQTSSSPVNLYFYLDPTTCLIYGSFYHSLLRW